MAITLKCPHYESKTPTPGAEPQSTRYIQLAGLSNAEANLRIVGTAGFYIEGLISRMSLSLESLGDDARSKKKFSDKDGKPLPLEYIAQQLGYRDDEFELFLSDLKTLEEWEIIEISGPDAAIIARKKDEEIRTEEMKEQHPDFVKKLCKALPKESSASLNKRHIYKAIAGIPDDEFNDKKENILCAAKIYASSEELLSAHERNPEAPQVIRANKFIEGRNWETTFRPAFPSDELSELRNFFGCYRSTQEGLGKATEMSSTRFLLAVKKRREKLMRQKSTDWQEALTQILSLETLKQKSTSPGWTKGNPPTIEDYVTKDFWKTSHLTTKASPEDPSESSAAPTTESAPQKATPENLELDPGIPDEGGSQVLSPPVQDVDLSAKPLPPKEKFHPPVESSGPEKAETQSAPPAPPKAPPSRQPLSPPSSSVNKPGPVASPASTPTPPPPSPPSPPVPTSPVTAKVEPHTPKSPSQAPAATTTQNSSGMIRSPLPPPPSELSNPVSSPPRKARVSAREPASSTPPAEIQEASLVLQRFSDSFPKQIIQRSNQGFVAIQFARLPSCDKPTEAQLQKLSQDIQRSFLLTLKRLGRADDYDLPKLEDLIRDKKWLKQINPAITPEQLEVIAKECGSPELSLEQHDEIFAEMIKGKVLTRTRDNGATEYRKPLDLALPPNLLSSGKKKKNRSGEQNQQPSQPSTCPKAPRT